jgi:hypothetical protein
LALISCLTGFYQPTSQRSYYKKILLFAEIGFRQRQQPSGGIYEEDTRNLECVDPIWHFDQLLCHGQLDSRNRITH